MEAAGRQGGGGSTADGDQGVGRHFEGCEYSLDAPSRAQLLAGLASAGLVGRDGVWASPALVVGERAVAEARCVAG